MMDWLQNPRATYVLAAYGVAAIGLIGLLLVSLCATRCKRKEWQELQQKRGRGGEA